MVTVFVFHMCNNFGIHDPNMVSDHYLIYVCIHSCSFVFYRSTFVGSAWSFGFFILATTANDLRLRRIFYPRFYPLHLISYLSSWERASIFPLSMLSAKQGHYWYHFYNVFGMMRSLTGDWIRGPHTLEASTLPLGYRGGGVMNSQVSGQCYYTIEQYSMFWCWISISTTQFKSLFHNICGAIW